MADKRPRSGGVESPIVVDREHHASRDEKCAAGSRVSRRTALGGLLGLFCPGWRRPRPASSAGDGKEVWSTDINNGVVHVFDVSLDEPKHVARLDTGRTPLWLTIAPDGKTVYVSNTADDTVSAFDAEQKREITRVQLEKGRAPKRILVPAVPAT